MDLSLLSLQKSDVMTNNTIYSARMKLADMILADANLLPILERLNIRLGFGDTNVKEVCQRYGLSADLFLIICNIYSFETYVPHIDALTKKDIGKILAYLRTSHEYYTKVCFPHLHENIHRMMESCDALNNKIINKFYDDYDNEVNNHFEYEEKVAFPYVESLLAGKRDLASDYNIAQFECNHSNIDEKLNDLKNIIIKYLPDSCSSAMNYEVLSDIFHIEKDLRKHTLIENKLLIPLVSKLEHDE